MTYTFLNKYFTAEFRNGFGFDIEACDGRPVTITEEGKLCPAVFEGILILVPFILLSIGSISVLSLGENNE